LFALLAGTGLRIGEALGLKLGEHLSSDFSTSSVRQSVWRGSVRLLRPTTPLGKSICPHVLLRC
jgi:integrase